MVWHERVCSLRISVYRLRTLSHVRVGSGENIKIPSPIDNPQTRVLKLEPGKVEGKWMVYIPASSIHGVVRSSLENFLRSTLEPWGTIDKFLHELQQQSEDKKKNIDVKNVKKSISKYMDSVPGFNELPVYSEVCYTTIDFDSCKVPIRGERELYHDIIGRYVKGGDGKAFYPCLVCQIFGATGLRGRIRVTNAYPSKDMAENLPLEVITRIAINRVTGAVEEARLFDLEAIPPGTEFYFAVIIDNHLEKIKFTGREDNQDRLKDSLKRLDYAQNNEVTYARLFEAGLRMVGSGFVSIGAHGNVGFGSVEISEVARLELVDGSDIKSYLSLLISENEAPEGLKSKVTAFEKDVNLSKLLISDLYPLVVRKVARLAGEQQ